MTGSVYRINIDDDYAKLKVEMTFIIKTT